MATRARSGRQLLSLVCLALGLAGCAARAPVAQSIGDQDVMVAIRMLPAEFVDEAGGKELTPPAAAEPTTAGGRSQRGDLYARAGYLSEALAEYAKAAALEPNNAMYHFKLGLTYQASRRYAEALDAYQKASRLNPESAWAHAAVSIVHAKMGNQHAALEEYQAVKSLDQEMAEGLRDVLGQYASFHET